jgi:hypothetical protein
MTLTVKDPKITLCTAEQQELRRFMKDPHCQIGVRQREKPRLMLVQSLAAKGYVAFVASRDGFEYYTLKGE